MAAARGKSQPIGSADWIDKEKEQVDQFVDQEVEEFSFSVRNELEWLNEHMAEIFSANHMNFADVFKTPGKLRGKTPRTARKQNVLGARQPLTDIFAPNAAAPPSAQKNAFLDKVARFQIAEDDENQPPSARPASRSKSPQRVGKPGNTDSGYHGMTEDEMDIDSKTETATNSSQQSVIQKVPIRDNQPPPQRLPDVTENTGDTSIDSFQSARENMTTRTGFDELALKEQAVNHAMRPEDDLVVEQAVSDAPAVVPATQESEAEPMDQDQDLGDDTTRSASDTWSPEKYVQRKSSFTFTSLPAREPLNAKRSIGARNSQIDSQTGRNSTLARSFGGKSLNVSQDDGEDEEQYVQEKSEESKAHNKTSTQLLQERINLLGKTKEPRPSKSIPQNALASQPSYPQLPLAESANTVDVADDSDDDWIAPTKPSQPKQAEAAQPSTTAKEPSPERPTLQKSISATHIPSPPKDDMVAESRIQKAASVSNPNFAHAVAEMLSTTPAGSPQSKKNHDGPLSASKNKLWSAFKSAKSIFASSASASAAAKLEAHNSSPSRSPRRDVSDESKTAAVFNMPGALYSDKELPQSPSRPISILSRTPSKKSRKSNESEKKREELKAQQKSADEKLEKAREKERQKAAKQHEDNPKTVQAAAAKEAEAQKQHDVDVEERPTSAESENGKDGDMPPPVPPKSKLPGGSIRAGRLVKPTKTEPPPSKPAPISIHVSSQSQRIRQASNLNKSQHESSASAPPPKQAVPPRPGSAQGSLRGTTAPNNARVKALAAAARKKEADEKAIQKKAEEKRERERERAAKAEEERRVEEEKKAAEQQRVQEAKIAAQRQAEKQAADAKRREQQRVEQMRQQEEAQKAKAAHELAEAIKRERAQQAQAPPPRSDVVGTIRQLTSKLMPESASAASNRPPVQPNPAKPAKRPYPAEENEPQHHPAQPPQRPGIQRGPPSYQTNGEKRRRTNEEDQGERHSVMAPPKRPSTLRKESVMSKVPHGYTQAPQSTNHHTGLFKTTQQTHKPGMYNHPSQMAHISTAKIPFAENANPPVNAQHYSQGQQQAHPGHENMQPGAAQNKYKTPARPAHQAPKSAAKSSPLYSNGDNIQLPDIATDSEDEDSEEEDNTGFRAPSWVASPALRELLTQQQLVNPESVFGPIGELKMDEVFRNGKNPERLKKFRDRGSSAAWVESGDAVTSAEKRKDMEMREKVVRDGGWRYEPNF